MISPGNPTPAPAAGARHYRRMFVGITVASFLALLVWPEFMATLGAGHAGVWFLDVNTLLASNDAVVQGLNPYLPNPLDYLRDSHAYSDWWLQLRHFGWGREDRLWLGALLNLVFFAAVFWRLKPQTFREALLAWMLVWSPPLMLGFNRANPDLLIFALLTPVALLLISPGMVARALAAALLVLAIGLKYYPVLGCALIFFTARSRRDLVALLLMWTVLGAGLAANLWDDVQRTSGLMAVATELYTFGAAVLAINLDAPKAVFIAGFSLALPAFAFGWFRLPFEIAPEARQDFLDFVLGAMLVVTCFALTVSYTYRLVFTLMMVPWLFRLTRGDDRAGCRYGRLLLLSTVALLWMDGAAVLAAILLNGNIPETTHTAFVKALAPCAHTAQWVWVLLLLVGLGSAARFLFARWSLVPARLASDRLA